MVNLMTIMRQYLQDVEVIGMVVVVWCGEDASPTVYIEDVHRQSRHFTGVNLPVGPHRKTKEMEYLLEIDRFDSMVKLVWGGMKTGEGGRQEIVSKKDVTAIGRST